MPRRFAPAAASLAAALCLAHVAQPARAASGLQDKPLPPRPASPAPAPLPPGGPFQSHDPADGPFKASEVTQKAVITAKPEPGFTVEARRNEVEGVVRLRAVLSKDGEVTNISVIKRLPDGLTEKAIAAARQVRFRPAQKDGRPVSVWVTFEYNFTIYVRDEEADTRAVIHEMPQPEYTEEARRQKVEGRVVLLVMLHKDGRVSLFERVEGLPAGLTEKAVEAALKIRFTPAVDEGRPANAVRRVEYVFKLD